VNVQGARLRFGLGVLAAGFAVASMAISGVAVIYPHYPQEFKNPTFDLAWRLVFEGYLPYSIGWYVGLKAAKALIPLLPLVALALGLVVVGETRWHQTLQGRALHGLLACGLAALLLVGASRPRSRDPQALRVATNVRLKWEPRDGLPQLPGARLPSALPPKRRAERPTGERASALGVGGHPLKLLVPEMASPVSPRLVARLRRPAVPRILPDPRPRGDEPFPVRKAGQGLLAPFKAVLPPQQRSQQK